MVYSDLMTNPLLVPVTILRGHEVVDFQVMLVNLVCFIHIGADIMILACGCWMAI